MVERKGKREASNQIICMFERQADMTYVDIRTHTSTSTSTSNKSNRGFEKHGEACGSVVSTVPDYSMAG